MELGAATRNPRRGASSAEVFSEMPLLATAATSGLAKLSSIAPAMLTVSPPLAPAHRDLRQADTNVHPRVRTTQLRESCNDLYPTAPTAVRFTLLSIVLELR